MYLIYLGGPPHRPPFSSDIIGSINETFRRGASDFALFKNAGGTTDVFELLVRFVTWGGSSDDIAFCLLDLELWLDDVSDSDDEDEDDGG